MRNPLIRLIVAAGVAASSLLILELALACDAPPDVPRDPAGRLREYDVVARGRVTSFRSWTIAREGGWEPLEITAFFADLLGHDSRIVIRVDEAWKGVEDDEIIVHDDGPDSCCGMRAVEAGDEVLVYAQDIEGKLFVDGGCVPIIPIADAQADLDYLGPGQREFRSRWGRRALGWTLPAIPLLVGGLLLWRRRAKRQSAQLMSSGTNC